MDIEAGLAYNGRGDLQGLELLLQRLPERIERRILVKSLRFGGRAILTEARALVPKKTRTLERSLALVPDRYRPIVRVLARSGKKYKYDGWYAHLVEFGTRMAPGSPFLRPAADNAAGEFKRRVAEKMRTEIEREIRGLLGVR